MTLKGFYFNEADIIGDKIQFESSCSPITHHHTTKACLCLPELDMNYELFRMIARKYN